ncbi:AEC family transporter [Xylophilus rhododendri]|uniref:AEC family transporter n=1 Tax=Xylophilus rhododendri TaxID=2697032 RepID=A0A857IZW7_9BURK|nr:AEC family transporter [Xylophilus rhododendri]QHI97154.1 AEC family transporter [Xylophilus rhododendri]
MFQAVFSALVPVVLFILVGYVCGIRGWIRASAIPDLSNLTFLVLTPALLFRTMSSVHVDQLDFRPIGIYFAVVFCVFCAVSLSRGGFGRHGIVLALAGTFSNTTMIGVPLVGLAFGQAGLVVLFTLISVHAFVLLTCATILLELAVAREDAAAGRSGQHHMAATVLRAVRKGILHPVPLPIVLGLLYALTGLPLPKVIDQGLLILGGAQVPVALVLVGVTLAFSRVGHQLRGALALSSVKIVLHPLGMLLVGKLLGLSGVTLQVMVVTAALPIGANVFLFSQRYRTAEDVVTASVAVSTVLALVTLPLMLLAVVGL